MSDQNEIMSSVTQKYKSKSNLTFSALTPNIQGYNNAVRNGCQEVAVFGAASEAFSQKNINCSIEESLQRFKPVIEAAKQDGIAVRGYVSCVAGCPYQGEVDVNDVVKVSSLLYEAGCYELSLGDTIGVGTPKRIKEILAALAANSIPTSAIALHCHDTYGQAIANCYAGLENDIRIFDSAVAGLGGCPYAKGASGNVSSEDLVYHLHGNGLQTGVDLEKLMQAGNFISQFLNRTSGSKVALASARKC